MPHKQPYTAIPRFYDLLDLPFEYGRYRPIRRVMFKDVDGVILDAGVGTGRNMAFYPPDAEITGIDLSPAMLARARQRKATLSIDTDLFEMDVTDTDFADGQFDFIIATFLFCVLEDEYQLPALKELRRVCKADGEIRILEYAYSKNSWRRFVMHLWAPWVRLMYGATFERRTEQYVDAAGLILAEERFLYKDIIKLLILRRQ
ncbi:MAG: class I SAM-dependent methyltransferase [Proteobacteria bacterium]|nr:class I SAM-dependent methyltransferase [Pseudomonadota bacterium]